MSGIPPTPCRQSGQSLVEPQFSPCCEKGEGKGGGGFEGGACQMGVLQALPPLTQDNELSVCLIVALEILR